MTTRQAVMARNLGEVGQAARISCKAAHRYTIQQTQSSRAHADDRSRPFPLFEDDGNAAQRVLISAADGHARWVGRVEQILELAVRVHVRRDRAGAGARARVTHHADHDALIGRVVVVAVGLMNLDV